MLCGRRGFLERRLSKPASLARYYSEALAVAQTPPTAQTTLAAQSSSEIRIEGTLPKADVWHFALPKEFLKAGSPPKAPKRSKARRPPKALKAPEAPEAPKPCQLQSLGGASKTSDRRFNSNLGHVRHVLGLHRNEERPKELAEAATLEDSHVLDMLIVAVDLEFKKSLADSGDADLGPALIGISTFDTRHLLQELQSKAPDGAFLDRAIRSMQFHVPGPCRQDTPLLERVSSRFTHGTSQELAAEKVSSTLDELLAGRDVLFAFHAAPNDIAGLRRFGVDVQERAMVVADTSLAFGGGQKLSIEDTTHLLRVKTANLHIAGNDARAALRTLLGLASGTPAPWPPPSEHEAKVQKLLATDGDWSLLSRALASSRENGPDRAVSELAALLKRRPRGAEKFTQEQESQWRFAFHMSLYTLMRCLGFTKQQINRSIGLLGELARDATEEGESSDRSLNEPLTPREQKMEGVVDHTASLTQVVQSGCMLGPVQRVEARNRPLKYFPSSLKLLREKENVHVRCFATALLQWQRKFAKDMVLLQALAKSSYDLHHQIAKELRDILRLHLTRVIKICLHTDDIASLSHASNPAEAAGKSRKRPARCRICREQL